MERFLDWQSFNAVVDAGSFVKAAEALHLSKAAALRAVVAPDITLSDRVVDGGAKPIAH